MSTKTKAEQEAVYTKEELMAAAVAAFGVKPEMVAAAMKVAGVTQATKSEAVAIIEKFRKMEVK